MHQCQEGCGLSHGKESALLFLITGASAAEEQMVLQKNMQRDKVGLPKTAKITIHSKFQVK